MTRTRSDSPVQAVFWFFGIGVALALLYTVRWVLLIALIGIGIGTLLAPSVSFLRRRWKVPASVSAFLILIAFFAGIFALTYIIYRIVSGEVTLLASSFPQILAAWRDRLNGFLEHYPWFAGGVRNMNVGVGEYVSGFAEKVLRGVRGGIEAGVAVIFIIAVSLYAAVNPTRYLDGILSFFPAYRRPRAREVLTLAACKLRQWFFSQVLALSTVGLATGVGLALIGVQYAALFGVLTAILDIVPYVGPTIAFTSIFFVTLGAQPAKALLVGGLFILIQQAEAHLVIPLVMKKRLEMPPIPLMILMLVMASWFTFLGVFVTTPLFCVLREVYLETYVRRMDRWTDPREGYRDVA